MVPIKTLAWTTRHEWLRGLILEFTSAADFLLTGLHVQNKVLLLTAQAFGGGNFLFGRAVMVVEHTAAAEALSRPHMRGSLFMGLPIVGYSPSSFATNAGPIAVGQPARAILRRHLDEQVLKPEHSSIDPDALRAQCAGALREWVEHPQRNHFVWLRATVTRMLSLTLASVDISLEESQRVTKAYLRRFAELSAFSYYAPALLSLLGTHEAVRREVYFPLKARGIDPLIIDMMMFAGMFSVGTIVMKCVDHCRIYNVDYLGLSSRQRTAFVIESLRLFPTVSTAHRILEQPEAVTLRGRRLIVGAGREIAYPFVCIHRNPRIFPDPEALRLDRPPSELTQILSWSKGPHACPARDLSVMITVLMLDSLAGAEGDLRQTKIVNFEV
jgi:hypothetical protein